MNLVIFITRKLYSVIRNRLVSNTFSQFIGIWIVLRLTVIKQILYSDVYAFLVKPNGKVYIVHVIWLVTQWKKDCVTSLRPFRNVGAWARNYSGGHFESSTVQFDFFV